MYIPNAFRVDSAEKLGALIRQHSFATLVTHDGASSFASHLPVIHHPGEGHQGTLISHMARANPQWRHFANGQEALLIFHGPHAYISPSWYKAPLAVPTWNYAAVHAYGVPTIIDDPGRLLRLLRETISIYESGLPAPWDGNLPEEYMDRMMQAIVGFEIPISRIEGKFKLGQNRSVEDLESMYGALANSTDLGARALAGMMVAEGFVQAATKPGRPVDDVTDHHD
jgi:transcriptional regulator